MRRTPCTSRDWRLVGWLGWALVATALAALGWLWHVDRARVWQTPGLGAPLVLVRTATADSSAGTWLVAVNPDCPHCLQALARLAARRDENVVGIGGRTFENVRNPFDDWRAMFMPHHWGEHPLRNPFMLVSEVMFDRTALLAVGAVHHHLIKAGLRTETSIVMSFSSSARTGSKRGSCAAACTDIIVTVWYNGGSARPGVSE